MAVPLGLKDTSLDPAPGEPKINACPCQWDGVRGTPLSPWREFSFRYAPDAHRCVIMDSNALDTGLCCVVETTARP